MMDPYAQISLAGYLGVQIKGQRNGRVVISIIAKAWLYQSISCKMDMIVPHRSFSRVARALQYEPEPVKIEL